MATINLGAIKFNWKGAYNSGTTYAVDDVVSSGGNSYVCIQAHSNQAVGDATAYWNIMSSKGTDADLINIASTAQGDIYYNNGSAIARLGAGTSGQFLKTLGAGANPLWGDAGGAIKQFKYAYQILNTSTTSSTYTDTGQQVVITPTSASNKILLIAQFSVQVTGSRGALTFSKSGDSSGNGDLHTNINVSANNISNYEGALNRNDAITMVHLDATVASTNAITYKTRFAIQNGSDSLSFGQIGSNGLQMYAIELDGSIVST